MAPNGSKSLLVLFYRNGDALGQGRSKAKDLAFKIQVMGKHGKERLFGAWQMFDVYYWSGDRMGAPLGHVAIHICTSLYCCVCHVTC